MFNRNAEGRITRVTDSMGNVITYNYDAAGDLTSVVDAGNNTTTHTYNLSHGLLDILDPLGRLIVKNIYDDSPGNMGRLIAQEDQDGHTTTYEYNARDVLTRTVFHDGTSISHTLDALDRPVVTTDQHLQ